MPMTKDNIIKLKFNNKIYFIQKDKLEYVLKLIDDHNSNLNEKEIIEKLKEYELFDECFLNNINKLW